jgi:UDP-N-acetylglucosamine diphosphorylase/glucosamine-1-phosphate N-acetyltransferase
LSDRCVIVFEDEYFSGLYPISLSHPTYDILCGAKTNLERIKHHFRDSEIFTLCRPYLMGVSLNPVTADLRQILPDKFDKMVLINGGVVLRSDDREFISQLKNGEDAVSYTKNERLVAAVLPSAKFSEVSEYILTPYLEGQSKNIMELSNRSVELNIQTFHYIWEPMLLNAQLLISDFDEFFKDNGSRNGLGDSSTYGRPDISARDNVSADTASVIDARGGPVMIEQGVQIKPFTYLEGPAFVGHGCRLVGGKMTGGCSFGSGCRIGGEIENTTFIGNSNKYHDGFIGHSYIGEWVNLGALTTNSDLKNNYSEITVKQNGKLARTGNVKIGCFLGDHTKTGIGTTLNTGTVIGFSCNIFGGTLILEKDIPSFSWGNDLFRGSVKLKDAIETAKIVCGRRDFQFSEYHRKLFEKIYDDSETRRKTWLSKKRRLFH